MAPEPSAWDQKAPELFPSCPADDSTSMQPAKHLAVTLRNWRGKIMNKHIVAQGEESQLQLASGHPVTWPGIGWQRGSGEDLNKSYRSEQGFRLHNNSTQCIMRS